MPSAASLPPTGPPTGDQPFTAASLTIPSPHSPLSPQMSLLSVQHRCSPQLLPSQHSCCLDLCPPGVAYVAVPALIPFSSVTSLTGWLIFSSSPMLCLLLSLPLPGFVWTWQPSLLVFSLFPPHFFTIPVFTALSIPKG